MPPPTAQSASPTEPRCRRQRHRAHPLRNPDAAANGAERIPYGTQMPPPTAERIPLRNLMPPPTALTTSSTEPRCRRQRRKRIPTEPDAAANGTNHPLRNPDAAANGAKRIPAEPRCRRQRRRTHPLRNPDAATNGTRRNSREMRISLFLQSTRPPPLAGSGPSVCPAARGGLFWRHFTGSRPPEWGRTAPEAGGVRRGS